MSSHPFIESLEDRQLFCGGAAGTVAPTPVATAARVILPAKAVSTAIVQGTYTGTGAKGVNSITIVLGAQSKHGGFTGTITVVTAHKTYHGQLTGLVTGTSVSISVTGDGTGTITGSLTSTKHSKVLTGNYSLTVSGTRLAGAATLHT